MESSSKSSASSRIRTPSSEALASKSAQKASTRAGAVSAPERKREMSDLKVASLWLLWRRRVRARSMTAAWRLGGVSRGEGGKKRGLTF